MSALSTILRRYRFRLRLRTLLLLVAALAVPCAWLGSEIKLVHDRNALIAKVEAAGGSVWDHRLNGGERAFKPGIRIEPGLQPAPIPTVRRWLGDRDVLGISIPSDFLDEDEKQLLELFPMAEIIKSPLSGRWFQDDEKMFRATPFRRAPIK